MILTIIMNCEKLLIFGSCIATICMLLFSNSIFRRKVLMKISQEAGEFCKITFKPCNVLISIQYWWVWIWEMLWMSKWYFWKTTYNDCKCNLCRRIHTMSLMSIACIHLRSLLRFPAFSPKKHGSCWHEITSAVWSCNVLTSHDWICTFLPCVLMFVMCSTPKSPSSKPQATKSKPIATKLTSISFTFTSITIPSPSKSSTATKHPVRMQRYHLLGWWKQLVTSDINHRTISVNCCWKWIHTCPQNRRNSGLLALPLHRIWSFVPQQHWCALWTVQRSTRAERCCFYCSRMDAWACIAVEWDSGSLGILRHCYRIWCTSAARTSIRTSIYHTNNCGNGRRLQP